MMTKRNLQLEEMAYNEMRTKMAMSKSVVAQEPNIKAKGKEKDQEIVGISQTSTETPNPSSQADDERMKQLEEEELKAAIQMSLALEDEKRKLKAIEEAELRVSLINNECNLLIESNQIQLSSRRI